jgi:hypothetical protein
MSSGQDDSDHQYAHRRRHGGGSKTSFGDLHHGKLLSFNANRNERPRVNARLFRVWHNWAAASVGLDTPG